MAAGGGAADAREQPRSGGRREPRRADRVRRHREGGPGPHELRDDPPGADAARRRGDAARAVGQARGRIRDPRAGAASPDREHQPRAGLGDVGEVPRARCRGADHVRADDRRLLDLHREPGNPPGDVRDVRGGGPQAVRRNAQRSARRHRRPRRDGRRAAARDHDVWRHRAVHRGRPASHRAKAPHPLPGRASRRSRRRARTS